MQIQFLGANRQVTGSSYLLHAGGLKILIDCGLFQERRFLGRNWEDFAVPPDQIDFVLLTHAHLDHCGRLPKLLAEGLTAPVITTEPSVDLATIVLEDSARIQEEDAQFKKKRHEREGRRGPHPEIPLYTTDDAQRAIRLLRAVPYDKPTDLNDRVTVRFHEAGHILGSAMIELAIKENGRQRCVVFSGDIGQWDKPLVRDPSLFDHASHIVMESTYGDRDHEQTGDIEGLLAQIINETVERGGNLIIPTFAIERAQELMYHLSRLVHQNRIPHLMVFLDSPMAVDVTDVFRKYRGYLDAETQTMLDAGQAPCRFPGLTLVRSTAESKAINRIQGSCIVMAGSGMCTGGRIKHHLATHISRPESTILFVGYQAADTLGRLIVEGQSSVRIHGQIHPVRAQIKQLHGLSAHADRGALWRWVDHFQDPPEHLFVTHGEEDVSLTFADHIRRTKGWHVTVPQYQQTITCNGSA